MTRIILIFSALIIFGNANLAVAQKVAKPPPLQPAPNFVPEEFSENVNTPGSVNYRDDSGYQTDGSQANSEDNVQQSSLASNLSQTPSGLAFYWIIIIVCALCLLLMLAWLVYRYRFRKN